MAVIKKFYPGFCAGYTTEQLKAIILKGIDSIPNPKSISMDGSGHDSHQHYSLIDAVDNYLWRSLGPILEVVFPEFPAQAIAFCVKQATDNTVKIKFFKPGSNGRFRKDLIFEALVIGTTFSGHPTRTTLGNTLRVMFYYCFAAGVDVVTFRSSAPAFFILVAGDDCVMWTCQDEVPRIVECIKAVTSTVKHGMKGLG